MSTSMTNVFSCGYLRLLGFFKGHIHDGMGLQKALDDDIDEILSSNVICVSFHIRVCHDLRHQVNTRGRGSVTLIIKAAN